MEVERDIGFRPNRLQNGYFLFKILLAPSAKW